MTSYSLVPRVIVIFFIYLLIYNIPNILFDKNRVMYRKRYSYVVITYINEFQITLL